MFSQAEQVDLLVCLAPVSTNALKAAGAVSKAVSTYRNHAIFGGHELAIHEQLFRIHVVCGKQRLCYLPSLLHSFPILSMVEQTRTWKTAMEQPCSKGYFAVE